MVKRFYRDIEELLNRIDSSLSDENLLRAVVHTLVTDAAEEYGLESGRLYVERGDAFVLIESVGEFGESLLGRRVPVDLPVLADLRRDRLVMIDRDDPVFDPDVDAQFTHHDYAAILVGEAPAYVLSFGIRHDLDEEGHLHFILSSIRTTVGLKMRHSGLEDQLRQARQIQMSLLPRSLPEMPGFEFAAVSIPADEVGGDIYDCQTIENGAVGLVVADASGHGLPAALQARDVMTGLRMGIAQEHKINTTMNKLNRVIHQSGLVSRFISVFYGELEDTGNLAYVNAGHCPPLLFTSKGRVYELPSTGPVMGPLAEVDYKRNFSSLYPGEALVLFSDGLLERKIAGRPADDEEDEREEYGRERLIDVVQAHLDGPADDILQAIMDDVTVFGNGAAWEDDVTVFVIRRKTRAEFTPRESLEVVRRDREVHGSEVR